MTFFPDRHGYLPIMAHRDEIVERLRQRPVVVVAGDTGSGKSTQIPRICLEEGLAGEKLIGCTQPRRIAAISLARRVTEELGPKGDGLVGYKIRFQNRTSASTRIKFMTDGVLLAEARSDRFLRRYGLIVVDEAHERSLNIDFLLGIMRRLLERRRDLKAVITSATIDTEKFARAFDGAPVVQVAGRAYPVEERYEPPDEEGGADGGHIEACVRSVTRLVVGEPPGDILVFMPTEQDIRETVEALENALRRLEKDVGPTAVLPLFGRLSTRDQARIFTSLKERKIVVATNIAETSLTVPGIRYVVDAGLARVSYYNPRARTTKMPVLPVSRASCDQRKGRCGRVGPGVCVRLYSEEQYQGRPQYTAPEIQRTNLAEVILRMLALGLGDPGAFPFIDPPSKRALADGRRLLEELGAFSPPDKGRAEGKAAGRVLSPIGRIMARLPLDPRLSRMIVEARERNALREVAIIAAALSIQDPRIRPADGEKEADAAHEQFVDPASDFMTFLNLFNTYQTVVARAGTSRARKFCQRNFLSFQRMREWQDIHGQLLDILGEEKGFTLNAEPADHDAVHQTILSGNLRNIAMKRGKNIYLGGGDKEVMLFPGSALFNRGGQWVMAAEFVETTRLYARIAANIRVDWIEPLAGPLCGRSYSSPRWEKKKGQVVAVEKVTLHGLIIVAGRKVNYGPIRPSEAREIFIQAALVEGELKGRHDFLEHNLALAGRLQDMEDRIRRRDIMVDDYQIYRFYDERLPLHVRDLRSLDEFLRKGGNDLLKMREEDLLVAVPEKEELELFPTSLQAEGMTFELHYRFEPGTEDDGVSAHIPAELAGHVRPALFEWLVPGMLLEKVVFLLKGLPKDLRRRLIPIPETAAVLAGSITFGKGSLLGALEKAISSEYGVLIPRSAWPDDMPDHLLMRFCLTADGKVLRATRRFAEMGGDARRRPEARLVEKEKETWERDGITDWDFAGLPEKIPLVDDKGDLAGFLFPAVDEGEEGTVAVRLHAHEEEAKRKTAAGILALYRCHFRDFWRMARKDFRFARLDWPLHEWLGASGEAGDRILRFVLAAIFETDDGRIPPQDRFQAKIIEVRQKGLYNITKEVWFETREILEARQRVVAEIGKHEKKGGKWQEKTAALYRLLLRILPPDFPENFTRERIRAAMRYLRALHIRLGRMDHDLLKDEAKEARVKPFEDMLRRCGDGTRTPCEEKELLVKEFTEMIEEFRVSLFAPEVKTAFPVSAKRLEQKWRELEPLC